MEHVNLKELLRIAEEQLARVKRGEMPTEEGKKLIGRMSQLKFRIELKPSL